MTSIPVLANRASFKLDLICQKLQQDTTGAEIQQEQEPSSEPSSEGGRSSNGSDNGGNFPDVQSEAASSAALHRDVASGPGEDPDEDGEMVEEEDGEREAVQFGKDTGAEDSDSDAMMDWRVEAPDDYSSICQWPPGGGEDLETDVRRPAVVSPLMNSVSAKPNKRKNFKPRSIVYRHQFARSADLDDDSNSDIGDEEDTPLDLTESSCGAAAVDDVTDHDVGGDSDSAPMDLTVRTPGQINSALAGIPMRPPMFDPSEMKRYAETTMKELLGIYGFPEPSSERTTPAGRLFEHLSARVPSAMASLGLRAAVAAGRHTPPHQQPPTPPQTPRTPTSPPLGHQAALADQERRILASMRPNIPGLLLPQNMATLVRLAAANGRHAALPGQVSMGGTPMPPSVLPAVGVNGLSFSIGSPGADKKVSSIDYGKYVKRFGSAQECGYHYCSDLSYREHFHCLECNSRVFIKKEEMIRHFKWHKKRDDSLQHGFMRYSPTDDCADRYPDCSHNRKQTHYHCLKDGCDKVYISTSDVQMHANYHRKDSAIQQEGFQRYRASEDCGSDFCTFQGQHTTHFHCKRSGCNFTFKNKADMEKHKTYHIKDEMLNKDGFKKYIKHERCPFENCRFSKVCNHIHCIRPGCNYVLHSSGQLFSHKRKHERQDSEVAYRNYRLSQGVSMENGFSDTLSLSGSPLSSALNNSRNLSPGLLGSRPGQNFLNQPSPSTSPGSVKSPVPASPTDVLKASPYLRFNSLFSAGIPSAINFSGVPGGQSRIPQLSQLHHQQLPPEEEEIFSQYIREQPEGSVCSSVGCDISGGAHFHCNQPECGVLFHSRDGAQDHARQHNHQVHITQTHYEEVSPVEQCWLKCPYSRKERHFHCNWEGCDEIILLSDKPFRRLDHFQMHDYSRKLKMATENRQPPVPEPAAIRSLLTNPAVASTAQGSTTAGGLKLPQSIIGAFRLPKIWPPAAEQVEATPEPPASSPGTGFDMRKLLKIENCDPTEGFREYREGTTCTDSECPFLSRFHYHCSHPRCFFASDDRADLTSHAGDFHENVNILEGFVFFNRDINCQMQACQSNKISRHFHCTRPGCGFSFVRYLTMAEHDQEHHEVTANNLLPVSQESKENPGITPVVKASGTYYPLSAFATPGMPQGLVLHSRLTEREPYEGTGRSSCSPELRSQHQENASLNFSVQNSSIGSMANTSPFQSPGTDLMSRLLQAPSIHRRSPVNIIESFSFFQEKQLCGRPFCKYKQLQHFHCELCNQAFNELASLRTHLEQHAATASRASPNQHQLLGPSPNVSATDEVSPRTGENHRVLVDRDHHADEVQEGSVKAADEDRQHNNKNVPGAEVIPEIPRHPMLFPPFGHQPFLTPEGFMARHPLHSAFPGFPMMAPQNGGFPLPINPALFDPALMSRKRLSADPLRDLSAPEGKKPRNARIIKDEPVPDGYIRFRYNKEFNEDCKYPHCGYREHQTHFHCMRRDCGYSFCDKTRFVQHTARHERLDTLMGGDFVQYRANIPCGREGCIYTNTLDHRQNKASHFHCLKCDFVCTDTNKVVAHRRQHTKLDSITQAGFEKFTPSQNCRLEGCNHTGKQTHYHCMKCQYAVLGLSQMSAHKFRHMEQ